jgi:Transposase IS66 family
MFTPPPAPPIAKEALDRVGQLYAVEKMINGLPPERRRQRRQLQSKPIAEALAAWAEQTLRQLSRKSELAQAFRYMRARWTALVRCFDDGRLALDNNPAERALRCVAIGRKNYLFAGSDAGGRRAAALYSLIESAKLNRPQPAALSRRRARPHRRPPGPPHRRTPALELAACRQHPRRRLSRPAHRTLTVDRPSVAAKSAACPPHLLTA